MRVAVIINHDKGRGIVHSLHETYEAADRACPRGHDDVIPEDVRFWDVPDYTKVGDTVALVKPARRGSEGGAPE